MAPPLVKDGFWVKGEPLSESCRILHVTFRLVPIVTGLEKSLHLPSSWGAVPIPRRSQSSCLVAVTTDVCDRLVEIIAGVVLAFKPKLLRLSCRGMAMGNHYHFTTDPRFLRRCLGALRTSTTQPRVLKLITARLPDSILRVLCATSWAGCGAERTEVGVDTVLAQRSRRMRR